MLECPVKPEEMAELLGLLESGRISGKLAKDIWARMWETGKTAQLIAEEENLFQTSDTGAIEQEVERLLAAHPDRVADYRGGKVKLLGWFVGQLMQATKGKANPQLVNEVLKKRLDGGEA